MATKLKNLPLEFAHFNMLRQYDSLYNDLCNETVDKLLHIGLIQVSTAFENAIANVTGEKVISEDHADLSCGSDAKLSTVRTSSNGGQYSAPVTGIHNKTGDLLVQVYERKQDKFYFFRIPYTAYCHIPESSNIEIPFDLDGTPRRKNKCRVIDSWLYECPSFIDMCGAKFSG